MATTPLALIVQAASYVLFPAFARITDDRERYRGATLRSLRMMCALGFPIGALLIPLGVPPRCCSSARSGEKPDTRRWRWSRSPWRERSVSFASEALKADGRPDIMARIHVVSIVVATVAAIALLRFDLVGVAAGVSIGVTASAVYGLARVLPLVGFSRAQMLAAIATPGAAALAMIAVLTPLEFLARRR